MKIQKDKLIEALSLVKPGLAQKEVIEQSTSFAFIDESVVTFNDELCIRHPIPGLKLEGAVKADELYKLLPRLKQEELELEITSNEILLTSGRTEVGIRLETEIVLPLDSIGKKGIWCKLPEHFLNYLQLAMGSSANDMSKPILTCVHVHKQGIIEGSDGMQIMRCELEDPFPVGTFLLPARHAPTVIALKPTQVAEGKGWIHFKNKQGTEIALRTFEDDFPNTDKFMDMEGEVFSFPRSFSEILERASVFSKRDHLLDEVVEVTIAENKIHVKAKSESGWLKENANIRYKGDPINFSIAPYLLLSILNETTECEISENRLKFQGGGWQYITLLFNVE